jgi:pyruvate/2-oxoglutarate/acetoin dehydrogenase E1 component
MKYVEYINELIKENVARANPIVLFGQNISAGSCISGLTKNLKVAENGLIINTPNCENALCGIGFGLMINGVSSIFFMKQQDFLLLGIDQLVNTYNFIRINNPLASFTIVAVVIDNGYQGLQSSLNNLGDFCSIARVPGFSITNETDAKEIINSQLVSPGFRIIGISQRLFKEEILKPEKIYSNNENNLFQYSQGPGTTIACFNFSFPYGLKLQEELKRRGINSSLFSVNSLLPMNWDKIIESLKETKKLVIIDDSKSENLSYNSLLSEALDKCRIEKKIIIKREFSKEWYSPNADQLEIDYEKIWKTLVL